MLRKIISLVLSLVFILAGGFAYCLDLEAIKIYFLEGDYKSAIIEGEKMLGIQSHSSGTDELYYILGLCYLKDGNYLRASDIFDIILNEFQDSKFKEEAKIGLGDVYYLKGDLDKAKGYYEEVISSNPKTKLMAEVYYRLSQVGFKRGDTQAATAYLNKLKTEFSSNPELNLNKDLSVLGDSSSDFYYSVQVGSFVNARNADNLQKKLIEAGYDAFIEEAVLKGRKVYRVKVGRLKLRSDAVQLESKLSSQGYPTKIHP